MKHRPAIRDPRRVSLKQRIDTWGKTYFIAAGCLLVTYWLLATFTPLGAALIRPVIAASTTNATVNGLADAVQRIKDQMAADRQEAKRENATLEYRFVKAVDELKEMLETQKAEHPQKEKIAK